MDRGKKYKVVSVDGKTKVLTYSDKGLYLTAALTHFADPKLVCSAKDEAKCCRMLDEALGWNYGTDYFDALLKGDQALWDNRSVFNLPPDRRALLEALKGPHGKTLLAAYRAKQGLV